MKAPKNEQIVTVKGVNSQVIEGDERAGHILLEDYDSAVGYPYYKILEEAGDLPGISALFQSSENSYHLWNLTVRSRDETALQKLKLHGDGKHNQIGYRRGKWTLRVAPKYHAESGEVYKAEPQLLTTVQNSTTEPQSLPHYRLLSGLAYRQNTRLNINRVYKYVGGLCYTENYLSMVDEVKEKLKNGR